MSEPSTAPDYSCAICLENATDPVVTKCGHLYCWPCLDQWLGRQSECPTCKGAIDPEKVGDIIPLYGKGKQSGKPVPPASSSTASSSSAAQAEADPAAHAFMRRHERPRAQREAPNPAANPRGWNARHNLNWGNSWGLFLFGTPTLGMDLGLLPLVIIACVAAYFIYNYWTQRARQRNDAQDGHVPPNAQQQNNLVPPERPNFIPALIIVGLAIFILFGNAISVDEEV